MNSCLQRQNGRPGGTRTPDHLVRSQVLYPTELGIQIGFRAARKPEVETSAGRVEQGSASTAFFPPRQPQPKESNRWSPRSLRPVRRSRRIPPKMNARFSARWPLFSLRHFGDDFDRCAGSGGFPTAEESSTDRIRAVGKPPLLRLRLPRCKMSGRDSEKRLACPSVDHGSQGPPV